MNYPCKHGVTRYCGICERQETEDQKVMTVKYIVFDVNGIPTAMVFPSHVQHKDVTINGAKPVSAGFAYIVNKDEVYTSGNSISLNLTSRKEDASLIATLLK